MVRLSMMLTPLFALPIMVAAQVPHVGSSNAKNLSAADFKTTIAPLFAKHCTRCHGGDNPKNGLSLEFADQDDVVRGLQKDRKLFERIAERIRLAEMPPSKSAKLSE